MTSIIQFDPAIFSILLVPMLGGIGLAGAGGVLGCFIVWRRMAYFGDTLAHASLLGISLGSIFQLNPTIGVMSICLLTAIALAFLHRQRKLADDTLLGIISHGALALGLILLSIAPIPGRSLHNLLLGDLVTLQPQHLINIYGYSLGLIGLIWYFWNSLTSWIIDEDLAKVEGHPVELLRYGLMAAIALFIALSMQFVGVLLITALLITPAASARLLAKSPEHMALLSAIYALISTILGTLASGILDWPLGPSIVFTASLGFGATLFLHQIRAKTTV